MSDRCINCDLPLATPADLTDCEDGCQCARCTSICWLRWGHNRCTGQPIDWRTRALDAERALADVSRQLDEAYAYGVAIADKRYASLHREGRLATRCVEYRAAITRRDQAIDALTARIAGLLTELKQLRKSYGAFRNAEIESLT